jgi:hypothetical protein
MGRYTYPSVESEKPNPDRIGPDGEPIYDSPVSGGFWIMRELLKSKVRFANARIYHVCPELFGGQVFDLVFVGTLLVHLRDPIGALMAARSVCADWLIASSPVVGQNDGNPGAYMLLVTDGDDLTWWYPNKVCYRAWFLAAGFKSVNVSRSATLTVDKPVPHPDLHVDRNITQVLRIADARVRDAEFVDEAVDQALLTPYRPPIGKRIYSGIGDLLIRTGTRLKNRR